MYDLFKHSQNTNPCVIQTNKKSIDAGALMTSLYGPKISQSDKTSLDFYLQLQGIALIQQLFIIDDRMDFLLLLQH